MKKIAVIAASGRTGKVFVSDALLAGHTVYAGVYGDTLFEPHDRLTVMKVDATSSTDVNRLLANADVVVSFIGHGRRSPPDLQAHAMKVVLRSMEQYEIRRIISLTGTGVRREGDSYGPVDWLLNQIIAKVDPKRITDGIAHAEVLRLSKADWTILRVLKLTNGRLRRFSLSSGGPSKILTSRSEVSRAALDVIEGNVYIRKLPVISRKK